MLADGRFAVLGGIGDDGHRRRDGEVFDVVAGKWESLPDMLAARRGNHALVAVAGGMLAVGGSKDGVVAAAELFDEESGRWTALPHPMAFRARSMRPARGLGAGLGLITADQRLRTTMRVPSMCNVLLCCGVLVAYKHPAGFACTPGKPSCTRRQESVGAPGLLEERSIPSHTSNSGAPLILDILGTVMDIHPKYATMVRYPGTVENMTVEVVGSFCATKFNGRVTAAAVGHSTIAHKALSSARRTQVARLLFPSHTIPPGASLRVTRSTHSWHGVGNQTHSYA